MDTLIHRLNSSGKVWYLDWLYGGVDFNIEGIGGEKCAHYLSSWTLSTETIFFTIMALMELAWGLHKLTFEGHPKEANSKDSNNEHASSSSAFHLSSDKAPVTLDCFVHSVKNVDATKEKDVWPWMKRALLVLLCMVFGIEIGYKFATKSIIWLLNPCHMITCIQIYLLASDHQKNCKTLNGVFRLHLYLLNGPLLAMIFYVVNTRFLPFEQAIYWIQHMLLYIIPIYLVSLGGSYTPDTFHDVRWPVFSTGFSAFYHFVCLQGLSILTQTNLNNILCPAVSDPFSGPNYRKWATAHQHLMIPAHGKAYVLVARLLIRILAAVQMFCIAVTLKVWRWTIRLYLASARVCIRACSVSPKARKGVIDEDMMSSKGNGCPVTKTKTS